MPSIPRWKPPIGRNTMQACRSIKKATATTTTCRPVGLAIPPGIGSAPAGLPILNVISNQLTSARGARRGLPGMRRGRRPGRLGQGLAASDGRGSSGHVGPIKQRWDKACQQVSGQTRPRALCQVPFEDRTIAHFSGKWIHFFAAVPPRLKSGLE